MRNRLCRLLFAASFGAGFVYPLYVRAACPDGYVQVGERREETDDAIIIHPICQQVAPQPAPAQPKLVDVTDGLEALAQQLNWDAEKRASLDAALNSLALPDDFLPPVNTVEAAWRDALDRADHHDAGLRIVASRAQGPDLFKAGAGQQTVYTDCAIFALANATGRPYGFVAASAGELLRHADWRPQAQRENATNTIEHGGGLNGGEVIFLGEAFGQVHTVEPKNFAKTLRGGEPLIVGVTSPRGMHEVVLSKAFPYDGKTWYEIIDSNQGPTKRLYMSEPEVFAIIRENAVAFHPDPGTTPKLFR